MWNLAYLDIIHALLSLIFLVALVRRRHGDPERYVARLLVAAWTGWVLFYGFRALVTLAYQGQWSQLYFDRLYRPVSNFMLDCVALCFMLTYFSLRQRTSGTTGLSRCATTILAVVFSILVIMSFRRLLSDATPGDGRLYLYLSASWSALSFCLFATRLDSTALGLPLLLPLSCFAYGMSNLVRPIAASLTVEQLVLFTTTFALLKVFVGLACLSLLARDRLGNYRTAVRGLRPSPGKAIGAQVEPAITGTTALDIIRELVQRGAYGKLFVLSVVVVIGALGWQLVPHLAPVVASWLASGPPRSFSVGALAPLTTEHCLGASDYQKAWNVGDFVGAQKVLSRCDVGNPWVLKELGNCRFVQGDMDEARKYYSSASLVALQNLKDGKRGYLLIWSTLARKRIKLFCEEDAVLKDLQVLLAQYKNEADLWHLKGLANYYTAHTMERQGQQGDPETSSVWERAAEAYSEAISLDSRNPWSWIDRLACLRRLAYGNDVIQGLVIDVFRRFPDDINVEANARLQPGLEGGLSKERDCFVP